MRDPHNGWSTRLLDPLLRHWQTERALLEVESCATHDVERMAQDIGVDALTLRALAARGPHAADLLPERLAGLGLDANRIGHREPAVLRDLERVCAFCTHKGRCARDIGSGEVPEYCPNADTLVALLAERDADWVH